MVLTIYGHDGHLDFRIIAILARPCITIINAKYKISLKLAPEIHSKCHLNFFGSVAMATKVAM